MKRLDEIKRLKAYARGLGVKIKFVRASRGNSTAADWALDGSHINIYYTNRTSMRYLVLSIIHELGHHRDFLAHGRREDILFARSSDKVDRLPAHLTKKHRKRILAGEIEGTKYWHQIYRDVGCTFPIKYLDIAMDIDIWVYRQFYITGVFPTTKAQKQYYKDLHKLYKEAECQLLAG